MRTFLLLSAAILCTATIARAGHEAISDNESGSPSSASTAPSAADTNNNDVPSPNLPPIVFDGETFLFAWEGASPTAKIKEFVPAGQHLDNWTRFVAINEYPNAQDPRIFAQGIVDQLKKQNPTAGSQLQENSKTGEVMLDFVTWPENKSYVEFDVFKFHKLPGGGIVGEQFAQRAYAVDEQKALLDGLEALKKRVLPMMAENGFQAAAPQ